MLVGITGDRRAVLLQVKLQSLEVRERAVRAHEAQLHQLARRVVDEDQERAGITAILDSAGFRSVDLHQLAVGSRRSPG